jgi:hypothetical protein
VVVAVTGAEDEEVGVRARIADDDVLVALVVNPDVEAEQLPDPGPPTHFSLGSSTQFPIGATLSSGTVFSGSLKILRSR